MIILSQQSQLLAIQRWISTAQVLLHCYRFYSLAAIMVAHPSEVDLDVRNK